MYYRSDKADEIKTRKQINLIEFKSIKVEFYEHGITYCFVEIYERCDVHIQMKEELSYSFKFQPLKNIHFPNDYLRSKGYALPWMDLSVEDLINYGWIKLKT